MNSSSAAPTAAPPQASEVPAPIDILLVMKPPEADFCAAAIRRCNPALRLAQAGDLAQCMSAARKPSPNARIIAFSTAVIVPKAVLTAFPGGGFNFHPGPPEYPGNRPSAFACYDEARQFGVTCHRMLARVDEGEIISCERFSLSNRRTSGAIAIEAYQRLARLFLLNVTALVTLNTPISGNGEVWSGRKTTMADFDAMRSVPGDIDDAELDRRIRAFNWVYTPLPA